MSSGEKNLYLPSLIPFWDAFTFFLPLHAYLSTPAQEQLYPWHSWQISVL